MTDGDVAGVESVKSWPITGGLPIDAVIPALLEALGANRSAVLQAPPGAGKSTVVPLVLLDADWARGKRIMMLEPRRLAARAVAQRMAQTLGQSVGRTVGYRMRMDTRVSRETRIEVVTEGVLTRMLQSDPVLEDFALVIFDEFHERSLQADLGLALTLDSRESLSSDLKILVMSATLDGEAVSRMLDGAPIVTAEGRLFPVESRYGGKGMPVLPGGGGGPARGPSGAIETPEKIVTQLIQRAVREESGDVLVFLPGAREIRRVQSLLQSSGLEGSVQVRPLFGELSGEEQDAALLPAPAGVRKVVLATNIAETSLTIEGVRVVVDSGLVRRSVFDASTGMSRLETQRISRASADQRQGRAGRLGPGVAYRAWSEGSQRSLAPFSPAEIVDADLVPLALELARWGAREVGTLRWLDLPPAATLASARDLLVHLGALAADGRITPHGREMGELGVHPRLSHMLLRAREIGCLPIAAELAALLSDRDVLRGSSGSRDADVTTRVDVLRGSGDAVAQADRFGLQRARNVARELARQVGDRAGAPAVAPAPGAQVPHGAGAPGVASSSPQVAHGAGVPGVASSSPQVAHGAGVPPALRVDPASASAVRPSGHPAAPGARREIDYAGILLAFAYPDRIGRRRSGSHGAYTLANGRGAHFDEAQPLAKHELIVAVDLDDTDRDARILLAASIDREDLEEYLPERLQRSESIEWNSREQAVIARRLVSLDAIVLEEKPLPSVPAEAARTAMLQGIRELGIAALPWTRDARDLQARIEFARRHAREGASAEPAGERTGTAGGPSWPEVSDAALAQSLEEWLAPWLEGITRRDHLARLSMADILRGLLSWEQQRELERLAPSHLQVPSGRNIRVDYLDESAPVVSVRLQEVFGLQETPRIGNGRVPVTFKLLSPAQRPVQVTRDLAGFWRGSYADVRKDMRGRYPKHCWPSLHELDILQTKKPRS